MHAERDKAVSDADKLREEMERCQSTLGKLQLQTEKTQQAYDKAQNEVDRLQERLDKALAEARKVMPSQMFAVQSNFDDDPIQNLRVSIHTVSKREGKVCL